MFLNVIKVKFRIHFVINRCTQGQRRLCTRILETIQFGISGSTGPKGRYCKHTKRKWTSASIVPQEITIHLHLGSSQTLKESEAHSLGRNNAAAPSQAFSPTYPPALSFDLAVQIADLLTSAEVFMPPAHVHNAPWLGGRSHAANTCSVGLLRE